MDINTTQLQQDLKSAGMALYLATDDEIAQIDRTAIERLRVLIAQAYLALERQHGNGHLQAKSHALPCL